VVLVEVVDFVVDVDWGLDFWDVFGFCADFCFAFGVVEDVLC